MALEDYFRTEENECCIVMDLDRQNSFSLICPCMFVILKYFSCNYMYLYSFPSPQLQGNGGYTPLRLAAYCGSVACVSSLLMNGMNMEVKHIAGFHTKHTMLYTLEKLSNNIYTLILMTLVNTSIL